MELPKTVEQSVAKKMAEELIEAGYTVRIDTVSRPKGVSDNTLVMREESVNILIIDNQ